ncbi:MAG: Gmad2 immunoglobulin-like domain-containing protein [Ktedonobacteraceae bacterium]
MQASSRYTKCMFLGIGLVLLFSLSALAACSTDNGTGSSGGTPTSQSTGGKSVTGGATSSVAPGVLLGVQPCPGATKNPTYWNPFILVQSGVYRVESVSCANIMDASSLQALVTVRHSDDGSTLDVYVFNNITGATPARVFQAMGLVKGNAKISGYNTVLMAQADELSALNVGKPVSAMAADLFREFDWSAQAGKLVQVAFPGIFPDLTRYQAETDQMQVNQGHQPWKLSATMVANTLAVSLLNWPSNSSTTLLSGGGEHDASAVVRVKNSFVVSGSVKVTLSRLEGNTQNGIWEAIAVESDGASLTSPLPLAVVSNPVSVKGTGNAFEGTIGRVIVLDHLYHPLGQAVATGVAGNGQTSFSTSVSYQSTFPAGTQEGVLFLSIPSNANGSIASAIMEKVLIPGLPQGN